MSISLRVISLTGTLIVVLDNCEHVIAEAAAVAETLTSRVPDLRLVATSREALAVPGEVLVPVGGLDLDAAVTMFHDRGSGGPSRLRGR